jgi:hypothetical protein
MEEKKYFMWYEQNHHYDDRTHITYGPHYYSDVEKAPYHELEDILKTHLSASVEKRLKTAKIGTRIKAHRLHSAGDMMLKRINEEEKKDLDRLIELHNEIGKLDDKKRKLQEEAGLIRNVLLPHLNHMD